MSGGGLADLFGGAQLTFPSTPFSEDDDDDNDDDDDDDNTWMKLPTWATPSDASDDAAS